MADTKNKKPGQHYSQRDLMSRGWTKHMISQHHTLWYREGRRYYRARFPNISAVLIATAMIALVFGACFMGIFYSFRPSAVAIAETSGLLGICVAVAIMAACRFVVQIGAVLLGLLWLGYIGWIAVSSKKKSF